MATQETQLAPYQSEYIDNALKWDILRFGGPFTLKSGRKSPYFFNAGLFNSGLKLQKMAECYANRIVDSGVEFDVLFGPAYKVRQPAYAGHSAGRRDSHGARQEPRARRQLLLQPEGGQDPR